MQNNYDKACDSEKQVTYAGFWVRLAAYLLDSVIVFFLLLLVRLVMAGVSALTRGTVLGGNILFHYTLKDLVLYAGQVLYFILFTYTSGTTLGKKAMNLQVVHADGESKLQFWNVVYRETVGRFLSGFFAGIGYWVIGMNPEKQGIHDMLCDTRVIYAKKVKHIPVYPNMPPVRPAPPLPPLRPGGNDSYGQDTGVGRHPVPPTPPSPTDGPRSYGREIDVEMPPVPPGESYRMVKDGREPEVSSQESREFCFRPAEPRPDQGESPKWEIEGGTFPLSGSEGSTRDFVQKEDAEE